jgi:hypothetical protein
VIPYNRRPAQATVRPNPIAIIAVGQIRRMSGSRGGAEYKSNVGSWTVTANSDGDRMVIPPLLLATVDTITRNYFIAVMGVTKRTIYCCTQMVRAMPVPAYCQWERKRSPALTGGVSVNNEARNKADGGGGRTRTYEGIASGFTVRPLCRSGHSPEAVAPY